MPTSGGRPEGRRPPGAGNIRTITVPPSPDGCRIHDATRVGCSACQRRAEVRANPDVDHTGYLTPIPMFSEPPADGPPASCPTCGCPRAVA